MRLFLVRHGQTYSNRDGLIQGQLDTELSELGLEQARRIAERLRNHSFTKIFSSDLRRAKDTAKAIAPDVEIIYDERLRERHFGDFSGKVGKEIDWNSLQGDFCDQSPPNGESWRQMIERVKHFLDELEGEGDVLLVSHGGVIRVLLHILLNRDLEDMVHNNKPKNTALYILEKKGGSYIPILENCDEQVI